MKCFIALVVVSSCGGEGSARAGLWCDQCRWVQTRCVNAREAEFLGFHEFRAW
jgi:hypothetical protein